MKSCRMAAGGRDTPERLGFTWSCSPRFPTSIPIFRRSSSDRKAFAKRRASTELTKASGSLAPPPDRRPTFATSYVFRGIRRGASSLVIACFSCHERLLRGSRHPLAPTGHDALHTRRHTARFQRTRARVVGRAVLRLARARECGGLIGPRLERDYLSGPPAVAGHADRSAAAARNRQHRAGWAEPHVPEGRQRVLRDAGRESARRRDSRDHGWVSWKAARGAAPPLGWRVHVFPGQPGPDLDRDRQ